jgi:hypothetical protein
MEIHVALNCTCWAYCLQIFLSNAQNHVSFQIHSFLRELAASDEEPQTAAKKSTKVPKLS